MTIRLHGGCLQFLIDILIALHPRAMKIHLPKQFLSFSVSLIGQRLQEFQGSRVLFTVICTVCILKCS